MSWHYHLSDNDDTDVAEWSREEDTPWKVDHYTVYLKIPDEYRGRIGDHFTTAYITRNDLGKVTPGDVLWIVNVHHKTLYLLGRLRVEILVDDADLALHLLDEVPEAPREWYAIANRYEVEPLQAIDITSLAATLVFDSEDATTLDIVDGEINAPQQLRPLRRLTTESAGLLEEVWHGRPESVQEFIELTEDEHAYAEGKTVVRTVKQRQRSRRLVAEAKTKFRTLNDGRLYCEACGFDFEDVYGVHYIEAHHTEPIADVDDETTNTTEALVMLCANCHRAAHTRTPPYSLDELKAMIQQRNNETS